MSMIFMARRHINLWNPQHHRKSSTMDGGQCNALENCTRPVLAIEYSIFFTQTAYLIHMCTKEKRTCFFQKKQNMLKKYHQIII